MDLAARTALVKKLALEAGFHRVGIARAHSRPADLARLQTWLDGGLHADMAWMARDPARRSDPALVVPGAQSVIMLALDYDSDGPRSLDPGAVPAGHGWISRYAWGDDYHDVAERRLKALSRLVSEQLGPGLGEGFRGPGGGEGPFVARQDFRFYVDYGPLLERPWAQEAGLGWQGRHSLLVDPERGSYFFLAAVVTSVALQPDAAQVDHCGSCRACVDACPTDAINDDRGVDARRCISALTIETKGALSPAQAALVGHHLFGCDICQEVCPFNRFSQPAAEPAFAPRPAMVAPALAGLLALDQEEFSQRFRRSPLKRRRLAGVQDNAKAVLRNGGLGESESA